MNFKTEKQRQFKKNKLLLAKDFDKEIFICLDNVIDMQTAQLLKKNSDTGFICLERALDTTTKYNLKHYLGDNFNAF